MANEALLIYKKLGVSIESDWAQGTITDATKLLAMREAGTVIGINRSLISPGRISGRASKKSSYLGTYAPKFTIPAFAYPTGDTLKLLKMALGQVSSVEVPSFVVTGHTVFTVTLNTNDYIDFIEGAGVEKSAQITAGSYSAFELCTAIKTAMEAANETDVTYTVTFSTSTRKFTITPSASTVSLLWNSGTNNAKAADTLLGFAADVLLSAAATSAVAVTHASANDAIDFTEDGGAEKTTYLAAGTYSAGATHADAGTLCALIKAGLEADNGTGETYSVAFSTTTKFFTITKGATVFVLKAATGENAGIGAGTLLGFAADSASAIAATSDTAVEIVWDHTFTPLDAITYGLSAGLTAQIALATGKVFDVLDGVVDLLKLTYKPNQELWIDAEVEARAIAASGASLAALTEETAPPFLFSQLVFQVGGVAHEIAGLEVSFSNNYKKDLFVNSASRSKFVRNGFREVKGTFTLPLADSQAYAIYDAFVAGTQPALIATFTAAASAIKSGFTYALTATLSKVQYAMESVPGGGGQAAPDAPIPFEALDDGTNGELKVVVRNNSATV